MHIILPWGARASILHSGLCFSHLKPPTPHPQDIAGINKIYQGFNAI
jgi:hypothetical protein